MVKLLNSLPEKIPVFPLSNFIIFPETTVPLNIFEKRYIEMIDDAMKGNRIIGMIQPKENNQDTPMLYNIGCAGKITSFNETEDGRYLIVLSGISRFKIIKELETDKLYRQFKVNFKDYSYDLEKRWWNVRSLEKYIESISNNKLPVENNEKLSRALKSIGTSLFEVVAIDFL